MTSVATASGNARSTAMFDTARLKEIHHHCAGNRLMVQGATICGCFYCKAMFPAADIALWCDDPEGGLTGNTAICPRCGVDAVLPDNIPGVELGPGLLAAMRQHFF